MKTDSDLFFFSVRISFSFIFWYVIEWVWSKKRGMKFCPNSSLYQRDTVSNSMTELLSMSKVIIQMFLLLLAVCTNVATAVNIRHIKRGSRLAMKRQVLTSISPLMYSTKVPSPGKGKGSSKSPSFSTKSPLKSTKMPKTSSKTKSAKKDSKKAGKGAISSTDIQAAAQFNSCIMSATSSSVIVTRSAHDFNIVFS